MKGFAKKGKDAVKTPIKQDVDEFWNDCIHVDISTAQGSKLNPNETSEYITFSENNNKKLTKNPSNPPLNNNSTQGSLNEGSYDMRGGIPKSNSNSGGLTDLSPQQKKYMNLLQKYSFDHLWTKEDLLAKQQEELKKKKSMERCYLLYEKGKIKNEVSRIMYQKNEDLKVQNELKECTWKPKLTPLNKKLEENLKVYTKDTKIYNRGIKWKIKTNQKINRSKSDMQREILENTYKPELNLTPNLHQVFDENKSIFVDHSNRSFVYRYNKARDEEHEKKKRLVKDLSKVMKDKWSRGNLNRSCSVTESGNYKQTLRDELHSLKYEDSDEN